MAGSPAPHASQRTVEPQPKLALMKEACAVAAQAAPYLHAKLTSVNATVRKVTSIKDLSDDELIALAASVGAEEGRAVTDDEDSERVH